jgi:hypothetical protein
MKETLEIHTVAVARFNLKFFQDKQIVLAKARLRRLPV